MEAVGVRLFIFAGCYGHRYFFFSCDVYVIVAARKQLLQMTAIQTCGNTCDRSQGSRRLCACSAHCALHRPPHTDATSSRPTTQVGAPRPRPPGSRTAADDCQVGTLVPRVTCATFNPLLCLSSQQQKRQKLDICPPPSPPGQVSPTTLVGSFLRDKKSSF